MGLTWVIHAYALAFGGLLLLGGTSAGHYGRTRVLRVGLALFGLASLAGGLAQAPWQLVAARAVQGMGAAALAPAALALLTSAFPSGRERVRAFGVWSATNAAGGALGVLAGGLLTEYAGWRAVMVVNVPIVVVALALAGRVGGGPAPVRGGRPDVLGAGLVTAGVTLLVFGVLRTDRYGWTSPVTLVTLAVAVAVLAGFVVVERTTSGEPLVRPALTGLMFLPFALGVVVGSVLAVRLGYRVAPRTLLVGGGVLTAAGFAWFGLITASAGPPGRRSSRTGVQTDDDHPA
ncbi:MFS transporter [Pseudonocardia sp. RS11V-5]|uniref:MFS transporter n=1 Tax=Pseudonocardia terrae TaxID=2905831 RepID=UPI001E541283|nr:MFS transporter [Pseudonocardia terrae]MCE3551490.1 MFS transporter [Pseudonocardia terrae]